MIRRGFWSGRVGSHSVRCIHVEKGRGKDERVLKFEPLDICTWHKEISLSIRSVGQSVIQ